MQKIDNNPFYSVRKHFINTEHPIHCHENHKTLRRNLQLVHQSAINKVLGIMQMPASIIKCDFAYCVYLIIKVRDPRGNGRGSRKRGSPGNCGQPLCRLHYAVRCGCSGVRATFKRSTQPPRLAGRR